MVKISGFWIPVVWGWLPNKEEISYKVFFLLIKRKMEELGMTLNLDSVLCDFELNILKSIDVMLKCPIHGCFFHLKNCFQRRVDRSGFKVDYENNEHFKNFINQTSALAHLPIEDVEDGLSFIEQKFIFTDIRLENFKKEHNCIVFPSPEGLQKVHSPHLG